MKNLESLLELPFFYCSNYIILPKGEIRFSQLFNTFRKDGECNKQRSQPFSKPLLEERKNQFILVKQTSTATLVNKKINEGNSFLNPSMFGKRKKEQLAVKLNRLKDRNDRYESRKYFCCNVLEQD